MAATQRDTLHLFTALRLVRHTWAGSLLVGVGLDDAGRALALAALAAGAASIFLEKDAALLRAAQREGCCTFTVTSLDEALRIVKNEVRQRRAITVGLRGSPATWLHEMVERGVQPQAFAASRLISECEAAAVDVLCTRGMQVYSGLGFIRHSEWKNRSGTRSNAAHTGRMDYAGSTSIKCGGTPSAGCGVDRDGHARGCHGADCRPVAAVRAGTVPACA